MATTKKTKGSKEALKDIASNVAKVITVDSVPDFNPVKRLCFTSYADVIERDLDLKPFPVDRLPGLGLTRSIVPESECQFVKFTLDTASNITLSSKALALRITTDELIRRLIWSFVS